MPLDAHRVLLVVTHRLLVHLLVYYVLLVNIHHLLVHLLVYYALLVPIAHPLDAQRLHAQAQ